MNAADCDLSIDLTDDGKASDLSKGGHAYCWAGVRGLWGVEQPGRYFFTMCVTAHSEVTVAIPDSERHLARFGVSVLGCPLDALGESTEFDSFAFGGTGKASSRGNFLSYGSAWGIGDNLGCALDLASTPATIGFYLNGSPLGIAFTIPQQPGQAFFPHLMLKNLQVQVDLDPPTCPQGFASWAPNGGAGRVAGPRPAPQDCELIVLVGLPGSG